MTANVLVIAGISCALGLTASRLTADGVSPTVPVGPARFAGPPILFGVVVYSFEQINTVSPKILLHSCKDLTEILVMLIVELPLAMTMTCSCPSHRPQLLPIENVLAKGVSMHRVINVVLFTYCTVLLLVGIVPVLAYGAVSQ